MISFEKVVRAFYNYTNNCRECFMVDIILACVCSNKEKQGRRWWGTKVGNFPGDLRNEKAQWKFPPLCRVKPLCAGGNRLSRAAWRRGQHKTDISFAHIPLDPIYLSPLNLAPTYLAPYILGNNSLASLHMALCTWTRKDGDSWSGSETKWLNCRIYTEPCYECTTIEPCWKCIYIWRILNGTLDLFKRRWYCNSIERKTRQSQDIWIFDALSQKRPCICIYENWKQLSSLSFYMNCYQQHCR